VSRTLVGTVPSVADSTGPGPAVEVLLERVGPDDPVYPPIWLVVSGVNVWLEPLQADALADLLRLAAVESRR